MPGYGRVHQENPPSSDVVTAWAQAMCNVVRAAGATQPVSLGDGAWGIEVTGRDTAEYVDFVGPRIYRSDTDTALVVPAFLERGYPYSRPADRPLIFTSPHQTYVAARAADLPAGLLREADGPPGEARLYLLPATRRLTSRTRRELARRATPGRPPSAFRPWSFRARSLRSKGRRARRA